MKKLPQYLLTVVTAAIFAGAFLVPTAFAAVDISPSSGDNSNTDITISGAFFFAVIPPDHSNAIIIARAANSEIVFNINSETVVSGSPDYFNVFGPDPGQAGSYSIFTLADQGSPCWADYPDFTYDCLNNDGSSVKYTFVADNAIGGNPNCGLGCAGIPTAYTAAFSSSTVQGEAVSAVGDLGSFALHIVFPILGILFALIAIGMGIAYIRRFIYTSGFNDGVTFSAGEIKKITDKYK